MSVVQVGFRWHERAQASYHHQKTKLGGQLFVLLMRVWALLQLEEDMVMSPIRQPNPPHGVGQLVQNLRYGSRRTVCV